MTGRLADKVKYSISTYLNIEGESSSQRERFFLQLLPNCPGRIVRTILNLNIFYH